MRMCRPIAGALLATVLLAGCSSTGPDQPSSVDSPAAAGPPREGPAARWSLPLTGEVGQAGDVLVVEGSKALRGLERSTGRELWKLDHASLARFWVASGLLVVWIAREVGSGDGRLEVRDPATGTVRWRADPVRDDRLAVHQDAVYVYACQDRTRLTGCTVTSRDVRTGTPRWQIASQSYGVSQAAIGVHPPGTPAAGRYVAARVGPRGPGNRPWQVLDRLTGRATAVRAADTNGSVLTVGTELVVTGHAAGAAGGCAVTVSVSDAADSTARPARIGYLDRASVDDCPSGNPAGSPAGVLPGAGSRIMAATSDGRPQLLDLTTGRFGWQAPVHGIGLDTDGRSVLVREKVAGGALTMLDFGTGKVRWTAPDPGPNPERGASRYAFVTERLAMVGGSTGDWNDDTVQDQAACVVYDVRTGRRLAVLPGRPAAAGADWVAVHPPGGGLELTQF